MPLAQHDVMHLPATSTHTPTCTLACCVPTLHHPAPMPQAASNGSGNGAPANGNGNGTAAPATLAINPSDLELTWSEPSGSDKFWTSFKLAFALPWRRFKKGSVLAIKVRALSLNALPCSVHHSVHGWWSGWLHHCAPVPHPSCSCSLPTTHPLATRSPTPTLQLEGEISDQSKGWLDPGTSIPQLCEALHKAALDPRVTGLAIEVAPLALGYAKLQEIRRWVPCAALRRVCVNSRL